MIYICFSSLLGLCIGSFLNVLIYRIPKEKSIIFPSSSCFKCNTKLKFYHNIPVFSWFFLKAKCAYCGFKISFTYPFVELSTAFIFIAVFFKLGMGLEFFLISLCFSFLLALSVLDIFYKSVPDSLNIIALSLAVLSFDIVQSFKDALLFGGGFSFLRFYLSYILKKEAAGEGDTPTFGVIGAILGVKLGLIAVYLSAIYALIFFFFKRVKTLPYIPFLFAALLSVYFFENFFNSFMDKILWIN